MAWKKPLSLPKLAIEGAIKEILSERYMLSLCSMAAKMIALRTQLGFGVPASGASREKLAPLRPATIQQRKRSQLNPNTRPTKSNLTRTGQLISSLRTVKVTKSTVTVGPTGTRTDGKKSLTNMDVARFANDGSSKPRRAPRPFNNLSDVEMKRLQERIRKDLFAALKKALVKTK